MKQTTWILIVAGMLTGGLSLHLVVTQPLHRQINTLSTKVDALQSGMQQVADYRDGVTGANDLLSELQTQTERLDGARTAIGQLQQLERGLELQSQSAMNAMAALEEIGQLQSQVIAQNDRIAEMQRTLDEIDHLQSRVHQLTDAANGELAGIDRAEDRLRQLGDFHRRVTAETTNIEVAESRFGQLIDLKEAVNDVSPIGIVIAQSRLSALDGLKDQIILDAKEVEVARNSAEEMLSLQDDIIARGNRTEIARQHAEQLLSLEDRLANDANRDIDAATENLAELLEIEDQLASRDGQLMAAIETLELMDDLQSEFTARTQNLESIRRGLTELILMESMVTRTVRSLRPLAELTDLRRLDSAALRSMARTMVTESTIRTATNDTDMASSSHRIENGGPEISGEQLIPFPPID